MANKKRKATSYNYNNQPQAPSLMESLKTPMEYIMRVFVLAVFVGIPLTFTDNATLVMAKHRTFFLMVILLGVAILFTVAFLLSQGNRIKINWKAFLKGIRPHEWALFAYWVVMLLSAALSPFGKMGWTGTSTRPQNFITQSCYILVFFLVSRFYRPSLKDLLAFCSVAALTGAYGICQYYKLDFLGLAVEGQWGKALQLISTMSNRNVASTYWTIAFCISFVLFVRNKKWRWGFFGLALVLFYTLLVGDTESGYVGVLAAGALSFSLLIRTREHGARLSLLLACCCILMWIYNRAYSQLYYGNFDKVREALNTGGFHPMLLPGAALFALVAGLLYFIKRQKPNAGDKPADTPKHSRKVWHILWGVALVAILLGVYLAIPIAAEKIGTKSLVELNEILKGNASDHFMSARVYTWRRALQLIPERWLLGYGPDCFTEAFNRRFYQDSIETVGMWYDKAHNEYLQTLVDTGVLGLLTLLSSWLLLFWAGRKKLTEHMHLGLAVAMLCYMVQAFFNFATPISHSIVWVMWGVFAASGMGEREQKI